MNYSYSAISSFKSCPRSFEFRYLKRQKEAFVSIERHLGTSIHEVLNWAYNQRLKQNEPDLNEMNAVYKKCWNTPELHQVRVIRVEKSLEDYYLEGLDLLSSFFQRVFPVDSSTSMLLEHRFEISLKDGISYRGIIDRVARQPEGLIRVTDFKTGSVSEPTDDLQLPSYAIYVFNQYPDEDIELCYEALQSRKTIVVPFNRSRISEVSGDLETEIDSIEKAAHFPANPSRLCQWCGYNGICESAPESVKDLDIQANTEEKEPDRFCPECGSPLRSRNGKFGPFLGCSNYPECRYTLDIRESSGSPNENLEAKEICPECGGILRERKGKFGRFMGCSNYPECRHTRKIHDT